MRSRGVPRSSSRAPTNYLVALATSLLFPRPLFPHLHRQELVSFSPSPHSPNNQKRYFTPRDVDFVSEFDSQKH